MIYVVYENPSLQLYQLYSSPTLIQQSLPVTTTIKFFYFLIITFHYFYSTVKCSSIVRMNLIVYCVRIKLMFLVFEYDHKRHLLHLGLPFLHCVLENPFCIIP